MTFSNQLFAADNIDFVTAFYLGTEKTEYTKGEKASDESPELN